MSKDPQILGGSMPKNEKRASMSGDSLPKTRDLETFDKTRGKVGWARWRYNKKRHTARFNRRVLDKHEIEEELDVHTEDD